MERERERERESHVNHVKKQQQQRKGILCEQHNDYETARNVRLCSMCRILSLFHVRPTAGFNRSIQSCLTDPGSAL